MSISTSSACFPDRRRRPSIRPARTTPRPTMAATVTQSRLWRWWSSARSISVRPVTQTSAICAACDPIASAQDTARPARYGFRKPIRRKKVVRCRAGSTTTSNLALGLKPAELRADEVDGVGQQLAVGRRVEPAARARRMRERYCGHTAELAALADAVEALPAEQRVRGETADGDDQL